MDRVVLWPERRRLIRGAVFNLVGCTLAFVAFARRDQLPVAADLEVVTAMLLATLWSVLGAHGLRALWISARGMPVFEADETGFRVLNRARRPWSDFRAVRVEGLFGDLVPLRFVTIETAQGRTGRFETLPRYALPDTPAKTLHRIEMAAARQRWVSDRMAELPRSDEPAPTAMRAPQRDALGAQAPLGRRPA